MKLVLDAAFMKRWEGAIGTRRYDDEIAALLRGVKPCWQCKMASSMKEKQCGFGCPKYPLRSGQVR